MTAEKVALVGKESLGMPRTHVRTRKVFVARKMRRKDESVFNLLCAWVVEHQIGISINLICLLGLAHLCFPRARRRTRKFFDMSYYDASTGQYGRGWDDMYFVFFWIVVFTGMRAAVMDYILKPLAGVGGIKSQKLKTRMAEQAWAMLYASASWGIGMYIFYNSPYWLNLKEMWTNFPTQHLEPLVKWYYLVQFAFWLQQLFVVNIEEKRKDHWQMFTHHIFTSALIFTSYGFYQTKVGNVILVMMDVVDILLCGAKVLNYLRFRTACDITFGIFLVSWFLARHICYLTVCWSIVRDVGILMPYGCYDAKTGALISKDGGSAIFANVLQPFNDPSGLVCFNPAIRWSFLGLLAALQILTLIWFGMIIRVAYGVLSGKAAQDSRSDDEGEDEDQEDLIDFDLDEQMHRVEEAAADSGAEPIELEVDAGEVTGAFNARPGSPSARTRSQKRSAAARASAISIPGHGDRKELLGRIGCDKPA